MSKKQPAVSGNQKNKPTAQAVDVHADQNVDKIRDILFGGQMRDYERRFAELDKRLAANIDRLSQDMNTRLEKLESYIAREFGTLTERLSQEKAERQADHAAAQEDVKELRHQTTQQVSALDDQASGEARSIRAALLEQTNELSELVRDTRDQLAAEVRQQSESLDDRKVAREDLAAMLTEVALRLNRDFDLPEAK